MEDIIKVEGLNKRYGEIKAVDDVSFNVEKGKLFAFLGPNGAGKSTTIDIISTLLKPDEGIVDIGGLKIGDDDNRIRDLIGVVFQDSILDNLLTVKENLILRGSFYGLEKKALKLAVEQSAQVCGLSEFLDRPYGKLSGGQKRRSDIARALVNAPEILFLDEPTTGLDPQTRNNIWKTIKTLQRDKGMTVFLTTHYMEEAADADYVVIIDKGRIVAKGTPSQLKDLYTKDRLVLTSDRSDELARRINDSGISYKKQADNILIDLDSSFDALPLVDGFRDYIDSFEVLKGTMDDAFIAITGKEIQG